MSRQSRAIAYPTSLDDRDQLAILAHVIFEPEGCWLWHGMTANGYPVVRLGGDTQLYQVHRLVVTLAAGPIAPELDVDHRCRAKRCVNVDHLEVVTHAENVRRGFAAKRAAA